MKTLFSNSLTAPTSGARWATVSRKAKANKRKSKQAHMERKRSREDKIASYAQDAQDAGVDHNGRSALFAMELSDKVWNKFTS